MSWLFFMFAYSKRFCELLQIQENQYTNSIGTGLYDWYDGWYCKSLLEKFPYSSTLFLNSSTDGLALFKTDSSNGLWPYTFSLLSLPPSQRHSLQYMFTTNVMYLGKSDGKLYHAFQLLFFQELKFLETHSMFKLYL